MVRLESVCARLADRPVNLARRFAAAPGLETLDARDMPSTSPFDAPAEGHTVHAGAHTWVADKEGLYHTATDLAAEWKAVNARLQKHDPTLTPVQRLEGNAETVFQNTGLSRISAGQQKRAREDAQREFDAIAQAQKINQRKLGIDSSAPFTEATYLKTTLTIQNNPDLYELGLQGHGLNTPPASRYRGYTNDVQNNVDATTTYIGGGLDNNDNAVTDFFDDVIMTHLPFPTVTQNGGLEQLNQNGQAENPLLETVVGVDDVMFGRVLTSADFAQAPSDKNVNYVSPFQKLVEASAIDLSQNPAGGVIHGLLGPVETTIEKGLTPHAWTADATGLFHTATDLAAEWQKYHTLMVKGRGGNLTPVQKLEGNAEAAFEAAGLNKLSKADQAKYREDAQRQFDAMAAGLKINKGRFGTDPADALTDKTYLQLERTIQSDATLLELTMQGHGLNHAPNSRYKGYTNDFQNNVGVATIYVGGGLNNGNSVLTDFFDNNILSHIGNPTVWQNGKLIQLNQNGQAETKLGESVIALDVSMFYRVYLPADFKAKSAG